MSPNSTRFIAVLLSVVMVAAIALPGAVAGKTVTAGNSDLTLEVTQDDETGNVTVELTENESAVSNATIDVAGDAYDGNGTYSDVDGPLELPNPDEEVSVNITGEVNDTTVEGAFTLVPRADSLDVDVTQEDDGSVQVNVTQYDDPVDNASVNVTTVDENDTYEETGEYSTDENGTVVLDGPDFPVNVTVQAAHDDLTATTETFLAGADLAVELRQHDDLTSTITVTRGETPIENATVDVSSDVPYDGNGTYTTDANGTVSLDAPDRPVNVTVEATKDGLTATETFDLAWPGLTVSVSQDDEYDVHIEALYNGEPADGADIDIGGEYVHTGTYENVSDGTLDLSPPANDTTITVSAEYENETANTTADIQAPDTDSNPNNDFARALVNFIHHLNFGELEQPPGQVISAFVHEHNPASADDAAGPPQHAGPPEQRGPSGNETANGTAKNETHQQGPPPWAGQPGNETDEADGNQTDERGPPGHATNKSNKTARGNGNGIGNGNGNGNGPP